MHLIFPLIPLLMALDHGGRYLHTQTMAQIVAAGLLLLTLKQPLAPSPLGPWLFPLGASLLVASLTTVNGLLSLEECLRWGLYLVIPYLVWRLVPADKQRSSLVLLFWGGVLIGAIGWLYRSPAGDFVGTLDRTNDLAGFLLPFVPLGLGLWKGRSGWMLVAGSGFLALTILLTASRAALLALVAGLFVFLALRTPKRHVFWLALVPMLVAPFLPALWGKLQSALSVGLAENSLAWRVSLWRGAWRIFQEHPWLGTGPGTFMSVFHRYQEQPGYYSVNAHSFVLQLLAEAGVVGALGLVVAIVGVLAVLLTLKRHDPALAAAGAGAAVASFIHAAFDIDYAVSAIPLALMTLLGLSVLGLPHERRLHKGRWAVPLALCLLILPALNLTSARFLARAESTQDAAKAESLYQRALRVSPLPSAGVHGAWGTFLMRQGRFEEAESVLKRAATIDPSNSRYLTLQGQLAVQRGKLVEAASLFQEAIRLNPVRHPSLYGDLAYVYLRQGQPDAAMKALEQGVLAFPLEQLPRYQAYTPQDRPQLGILYQTLSRLYRQAGRLAEADKTATIAQALLPSP